ncbi:hypothetical protein [Psychroserpens mesophilus]|uniref:hypothetical protein n=1 Tax=Psychroserpens mesophilus TaxID=325473 RepID=UPI00058D3DF2|nr:hypothetical protein [Psychroserpens mesophilus]
MTKSKLLLNRLLILIFILTNSGIQAQNLFNEKFEGCNTDRFGTEQDSIKVRPTEKDIVYVLENNLNKESIKKIRGLISFQIIVDLDGKSCLVSVDNETNISTTKLNLKEIIDQNLIWQKPTEKTSVIVAIKFHRKKVEKKRIGMNRKKGFYPIE